MNKPQVLDFVKGLKKKWSRLPARRARPQEVSILLEMPREDLENLQLAAQVTNQSIGDIIRQAVKKHLAP